MSYVYIQTERNPALFTVGFYRPDGSFDAESDHSKADEAAARVAWLNGSPRRSGALEYQCVDCYDDVWRWCIVANYDGQCGDVLCVLHAEDGSPLGDLASRIIESGVLK